MGADDMKLAGLQNVRVISGLIPKLMEIADPVQGYWHRIEVEQLAQVVKVSLKYQSKMIAVEMDRLKVQQEAIGEMEKLVGGFRR